MDCGFGILYTIVMIMPQVAGGSKWIQKRGEEMTERDFQGFYDPDHTSLEAAK